MKNPSFAKYAVVLLLLAGLVALTAPSAKAQNNATASVTVTVAEAIGVAKTGDMNWGLLAAPTTGTGNSDFRIATDGTVSLLGTGSQTGKVLTSAGSSAEFTVEGETGETVTLTLSKTDPDGTNAILSALVSDVGPTLTLTSGTDFVIVTADLELTPEAADGTFVGSITLTANY